ncbi:MAG: cohesin domain-containing protein [Candidatus Gottesmanbacteria bacterium]|nr:cohesin domain-containing protein [Candidatus Gottesmanbacteria bacterium]
MKRNSKLLIVAVFSALLLPGAVIHAQQKTVQINVSELLPHVEVSFAPQSGTFVEGSTFQVPILVNTKGTSINGIDLKISFDANKLSIIQPSNGKSIIGVWVEPPAYDNSRGTASFVGVIPNGITTSSGLIGTITFIAKGIGEAVVSFKSNSSILVNDGLGSVATTNFRRAGYNIIPKPPEGVIIYSETHPSQSTWYNNKNPFFTWDKEKGVTGFSYVLDNMPSTIPDNNVLTTDTIKAYQNLNDGIYYFHIKAIKNGVWGTTGTFLVKIDTTPPADFKPRAEYVVAAVVMVERVLVSFLTTDNLSGIDYYEVGVIDKSQPATESPVFTVAESPFQVPFTGRDALRVIVRAVDKAGNIKDESINVQAPLVIGQFIKDYSTYILLGILLLAVFMLLIHYLFGHKLLAHLRRAFAIVKEEEASEHEHTAQSELNRQSFNSTSIQNNSLNTTQTDVDNKPVIINK